MIHVESFEVSYPPFSCVLKLVVKLFLLKSFEVPSLQDIRNFGFLCLMGILIKLRYFFLHLEVAYPPHFEMF